MKRKDAHSYDGESADGPHEHPGEGDGPLKGQGPGSTPNDAGTQAETADGIDESDQSIAGAMVGKFNEYGPGKAKRQGYVDVAGSTDDGSAGPMESEQGSDKA